MEAESLHFYGTPAHLEGESMHFYGTPAHLEGESLHFYGTPAHLEGESMHFYGTPAHLEASYLHFYGTPAYLDEASSLLCICTHNLNLQVVALEGLTKNSTIFPPRHLLEAFIAKLWSSMCQYI